MKAIFILDSDGNRVCAKYYDKSYPTAKDQLALEKKLYLKTKNSNPRLEGALAFIRAATLVRHTHVSLSRSSSLQLRSS